MKTEWVHKKLGDCCESELGKTLDEGRNTGLYRPYLCALNVLWGKIDISIIKQMRIEDSELERYLVKKGDLLVCEGGEIGRCAIWENDDEIYYQNALHRVRFYKEYDAYFFMYLLCHYNDLKLIEQYGKGLTIKHLNQTAFRNIPVCVPDLSAQRRIAAILASADKVIAATQKTIAKYKQMKQGMMEDLLKPKEGWKMVKLGECCTVNPKTDTTKVLDDDIVALVRMEDVSNDGFITSFSERTYKSLQKRGLTIFQNEDVIFAKITPCMENGKGALVRNMKSKICMGSTEFHVLRACDNVSIDFIYQLTISKRFRQKAEMQMTGSAGQQRVPTTFLEDYLVSIPFKNGKPDLTEQRHIAAILSGIDAKIAAEEKVLEKYEKVKKGLMERMLNEKY